MVYPKEHHHCLTWQLAQGSLHNFLRQCAINSLKLMEKLIVLWVEDTNQGGNIAAIRDGEAVLWGLRRPLLLGVRSSILLGLRRPFYTGGGKVSFTVKKRLLRTYTPDVPSFISVFPHVLFLLYWISFFSQSMTLL